jgi:hypothetical protein
MTVLRVNDGGMRNIPLIRAGQLTKADVLNHLHLISHPDLNFNIMRVTVSAGLIRPFVNSLISGSAEKMVGYNVEPLKPYLKDILDTKTKGPFSLHDGWAYANWLNDGTGRKLRLPKDFELLSAQTKLGNKLGCKNDREWTDTQRGTYTYDLYILNNIKHINHFADTPDSRSNGSCFYTFRLVEDKII